MFVPLTCPPPDRARYRRGRSGELERMDARIEHADRLVDFLCVRETHQRSGTAAVVSVQSGALLLCPSGETLGHVWRGAVGSPSPDDRRMRGVIAVSGHLAAVPVLRAN